MRYGIAIDIISFLFLTRIYFFVFWPPSAPVAVKSMNGALVMNGGVVIWSLAYSIRLAGGPSCVRGVGPVSVVKRVYIVTGVHINRVVGYIHLELAQYS